MATNGFYDDEIFNLCEMEGPVLEVQALSKPSNHDGEENEPAAAQKQPPSRREKNVARQQPPSRCEKNIQQQPFPGQKKTARRHPDNRLIIIKRDVTGHASPLQESENKEEEEEEHPVGN
ncbi:hypothetical protein PUN28_008226 [Cardiocondyla obscurior]|uniref:Uncharacterized protein n=1 Tax=Cardiocondyla obscurior TaxID=286306 RepID=A0AAW2FYD5_9HYME